MNIGNKGGNMKMKNILYILFPIACLYFIGSCKKSDDHYYDYHEKQTFDGSIYSYLSKQPHKFDSLILVLDYLPELKTFLDTEKDISFFAPSNKSFEIAINNLNAQRKQRKLGPMYLEDIPIELIDSLLYRYMMVEEYSTNTLLESKDGISVPSFKKDYIMNIRAFNSTASGLQNIGQLQIDLNDTNGLTTEKDWLKATTELVDIKSNNGILHVLNPYHEFGYGKIAKTLIK